MLGKQHLWEGDVIIFHIFPLFSLLHFPCPRFSPSSHLHYLHLSLARSHCLYAKLPNKTRHLCCYDWELSKPFLHNVGSGGVEKLSSWKAKSWTPSLGRPDPGRPDPGRQGPVISRPWRQGPEICCHIYWSYYGCRLEAKCSAESGASNFLTILGTCKPAGIFKH